MKLTRTFRLKLKAEHQAYLVALQYTVTKILWSEGDGPEFEADPEYQKACRIVEEHHRLKLGLFRKE